MDYSINEGIMNDDLDHMAGVSELSPLGYENSIRRITRNILFSALPFIQIYTSCQELLHRNKILNYLYGPVIGIFWWFELLWISLIFYISFVFLFSFRNEQVLEKQKHDFVNNILFLIIFLFHSNLYFHFY